MLSMRFRKIRKAEKAEMAVEDRKQEEAHKVKSYKYKLFLICYN
jgi:hypothetical protein